MRSRRTASRSPTSCGSTSRLQAVAAARGLPLVPGHDPLAWLALTAELVPGSERAAPQPADAS